jgi:MFS family permease
MTLVAFEGVAVGTVMPAVGLDLDGIGIYAWAFNAYVVASLVGMVIAGTWSDRVGPRIPLLSGMAVFACGAIAAGFAPTMWILITARGVQGLGGGAIVVAIYVFIARAFDEELRPRAFSLLAAAWVVPSLIGPLIAGWLTDSITWRAVFWLVPIVLLLPVVLLRGVLSQYDGGTGETGRSSRSIPAIVTAVGLTVAMTGLVSPAVPLVASATLVVVGLLLVGWGARRLLPRGALHLARGLPTTVVMRGILAAAFFTAEAFAPLALVEQRGVSILVAGLLLSVASLGWMVGSFLQGRLPGDMDRGSTVRLGAVIIAASIATLPLCLLPGLPPMIASVSMFTGSVGMGLCFPSIAVQTLRLSADHEQGINSSSLQMSDAILSALALAIAGAIHATAVAAGGATPRTYDVIWVLAAAIALGGAVAAGRMRPARVPA